MTELDKGIKERRTLLNAWLQHFSIVATVRTNDLTGPAFFELSEVVLGNVLSPLNTNVCAPGNMAS